MLFATVTMQLLMLYCGWDAVDDGELCYVAADQNGGWRGLQWAHNNGQSGRKEGKERRGDDKAGKRENNERRERRTRKRGEAVSSFIWFGLGWIRLDWIGIGQWGSDRVGFDRIGSDPGQGQMDQRFESQIDEPDRVDQA
jgi:hypothetical protein